MRRRQLSNEVEEDQFKQKQIKVPEVGTNLFNLRTEEKRKEKEGQHD